MLAAPLNDDRSADNTFASGLNYRTSAFSAGSSNAAAVLIDSGRPVIAGAVQTGTPGNGDLAIARLQSDLIFRDRFE